MPLVIIIAVFLLGIIFGHPVLIPLAFAGAVILVFIIIVGVIAWCLGPRKTFR
jgi:hypothetical protein